LRGSDKEQAEERESRLIYFREGSALIAGIAEGGRIESKHTRTKKAKKNNQSTKIYVEGHTAGSEPLPCSKWICLPG
jgi:hypothetical protein